MPELLDLPSVEETVVPRRPDECLGWKGWAPLLHASGLLQMPRSLVPEPRCFGIRRSHSLLVHSCPSFYEVVAQF